MDNNRFRGQLQGRYNQLESVITSKTAALKDAPEGKLYICSRKNCTDYYIVDANNKRKYISSDNMELIISLAQKSYDEKTLELAMQEKECIEKLLSKYPKVCLDEYYSSLPVKRRSLISPLLLPDDEYIENWYARPDSFKEISGETAKIYTTKGEIVRSKSEKIIADRLADLGIPYKYEAALTLKNNYVIHPDFTILDMKRRCEVYLEHCGMIDNVEYSDNLTKRITLYSLNGIVLSDRLMLTFETSNVPFDSRVLNQYFVWGKKL